MYQTYQQLTNDYTNFTFIIHTAVCSRDLTCPGNIYRNRTRNRIVSLPANTSSVIDFTMINAHCNLLLLYIHNIGFTIYDDDYSHIVITFQPCLHVHFMVYGI